MYWNTRGIGDDLWVIHTQQARYGYAIGTRGSVPEVRTAEVVAGSASKTDPVDHVEGETLGASLEPPSLYVDQLGRRLAQDPTSAGPSLPTAVEAGLAVRFDGRGILLGEHRADGTRTAP